MPILVLLYTSSFCFLFHSFSNFRVSQFSMGLGGLGSDSLGGSVDITFLCITNLSSLIPPIFSEPSGQSFLRFLPCVSAASSFVFLNQQTRTICGVCGMLFVDLGFHLLVKFGIARLAHFNLKRNLFCCLLDPAQTL